MKIGSCIFSRQLVQNKNSNSSKQNCPNKNLAFGSHEEEFLEELEEFMKCEYNSVIEQGVRIWAQDVDPDDEKVITALDNAIAKAEAGKQKYKLSILRPIKEDLEKKK